MDFGMDGGDTQAWSSLAAHHNLENDKSIRKHEIYDNTMYIPDENSRVLEVNMNSSLNFQMLLYYHFFFDLLYMFLIFPASLYKFYIFKSNIFTLLSLILLLLWFPIEMFRLNFGYRGNINESFPEFVAFVIFTLFFSLIFSIVIAINPTKFPHEFACYAFNFTFIILELIFSIYLIFKFARKQKAHYTLRTEPGLDKDFKLKYA